MPTLVTHTENVKTLQEHINKGVYDDGNFMPLFFTIRGNEFMEKTKKTGRYIMPSGDVVDRSTVSIRDRFVEYGPEDIEFLVYAGVIREETEMLVTMVDDMWLFRMMVDTPFVMENRRVIVSSGVV